MLLPYPPDEERSAESPFRCSVAKGLTPTLSYAEVLLMTGDGALGDTPRSRPLGADNRCYRHLTSPYSLS